MRRISAMFQTPKVDDVREALLALAFINVGDNKSGVSS